MTVCQRCGDEIISVVPKAITKIDSPGMNWKAGGPIIGDYRVSFESFADKKQRVIVSDDTYAAWDYVVPVNVDTQVEHLKRMILEKKEHDAGTKKSASIKFVGPAHYIESGTLYNKEEKSMYSIGEWEKV